MVLVAATLDRIRRKKKLGKMVVAVRAMPDGVGGGDGEGGDYVILW